MRIAFDTTTLALLSNAGDIAAAGTGGNGTMGSKMHDFKQAQGTRQAAPSMAASMAGKKRRIDASPLEAETLDSQINLASPGATTRSFVALRLLEGDSDILSLIRNVVDPVIKRPEFGSQRIYHDPPLLHVSLGSCRGNVLFAPTAEKEEGEEDDEDEVQAAKRARGDDTNVGNGSEKAISRDVVSDESSTVPSSSSSSSLSPSSSSRVADIMLFDEDLKCGWISTQDLFNGVDGLSLPAEGVQVEVKDICVRSGASLYRIPLFS